MGAPRPIPLSLEPSSLPLLPAAPVTGLAEVGAGGPAGWERSGSKGDCFRVGMARLASPALQAGLDMQGLLTEKWEELCSQLSEHSGRLGALEQTQNVAGRIARRGLRCRKPSAGTEQGGWDRGEGPVGWLWRGAGSKAHESPL